MSDTNFYRAFEDKHRGGRELIKSRLEIYLPFIMALKQSDKDLKTLDLGCGRGEWLELLSEQGFDPYGVDLDEGMLHACTQLRLNVEKKDALSALAALPDESRAIISGFHIVEHLPFEVLQRVIQEALRVLKPGGILILETPNPENIVVATSGFYLDPTHVKPIPQELLAFMVEHYGFHRAKILRLQETRELRASSEPNLLDVMFGVSPDYAIVAQKGASEEILSRFDAPFSEEYGLGLEELISRYDQRIAGALSHALEEARQARILSQDTQRGLESLLHSRSWRWTAPLRGFGSFARKVKKILTR
ncbi:class I SAM-dependent methyltransferase [Sulfuricurvum sp.]|uniref:class I SAM-dependent methyltransferase n=1 Tax=Sulfuricurvum sp. TaxID=2025608 RepID=UPI003565315B